MASSNMVQSLQRALGIIEHVARTDNGMRLCEISERLNLKPPTVHNLARTLCARGYLSKDSASRYRMGPAFDAMIRDRHQRNIVIQAEAAMRELCLIHKEATITFCELTGNDICCRLRIAPELPGIVQRPQTQTFSAFASASGLCLQAFNVDYRDTMASAAGFDESGQSYWANRASFDRALSETIQNGLAVIPGASVWRMAAPVRERYTLGISLEMTEKDRKMVSDKLRKTAATLADPEGSYRVNF